MIVLRRGSDDEVYWEHITERNLYCLADDLSGMTVLDIGSHIGSFAWACLSRGAECLDGYEMHRDTWRVSELNVSDFGNRAVMHHALLWSEDGPDVRPTSEYDHPVAGKDFGHRKTLDYVIHRLMERSGRECVSLLKVDIEGAEYEVMYPAQALCRVDAIALEYHDLTLRSDIVKYRDPAMMTWEAMAAFLEGKGFTVEAFPGDKGYGMLFCWQRDGRKAFAPELRGF